jgi:uncharacterized protein YjbI with pentapeptide repeats
MANEQHVRMLAQGVSVWNQWRTDHPRVRPDLAGLRVHEVIPIGRLGIDLSHANFRNANLEGADLFNTWLVEADFSGAKASHAGFGGVTAGSAKFVDAILEDAHFMQAILPYAVFTGANLTRANFHGACLDEANLNDHPELVGALFGEASLKKTQLSRSNLSGANLRGASLLHANLSGSSLHAADLREVLLVDTNIEGANFEGALVHGASIWSLIGVPKTQRGLVITSPNEPQVTVDDLEVAQFIYLLLNREKLRNVIETITSKAVLILGRFTPKRKVFLDALAKEVRKHRLLPIIFDFERATTRDFTETIKVLAGMSTFVIADITNPSSAPLELQATVPDYQIPFVPIIQKGEEPFAMFRDLKGKYDWVLGPVITYSSIEKLTKGFKKGILDRARKKHQELAKRKTAPIKMQSIEDF